MHRLDHVIVMVRDLTRAIDDFGRLGFTVLPGGPHVEEPTHNAIIPFADGTYVEVLSFRKWHIAPLLRLSGRLGLVDVLGAVTRQSPLARRYMHHGARPQPEGLVDVVLQVGEPDATACIERARTRGLVLDGPVAVERQRPDGLEVRCQTFVPHSMDLPYLCIDLTPRQNRVPPGVAHRNGARGISAVDVEAVDVTATLGRYAALLDVTLASRAATGGSVPLGGGSLNVRQAAGTREGPSAVWLDVDERGAEGPLDPALAHGARLVCRRAS
jgi:hypothetical protein